MAVAEQACSRGARVVEEPAEHPFGERQFSVADLGSHRWQFTETLRDARRTEYGCTTVEPWPARD